MPTKSDLMQRQALPLSAKILMSQNRIREWYQHFNGDVCISFSGGKDSTVLAHLVHDMYQDVPLVFCNTGLEYPEIQAFAKKMGAEFIRPKMSFSEVISTHGYPIISKENAEAIHYARKIRNVGGVQQKKEREQNLKEEEQPERSRPFRVGGGYRETAYRRATFLQIPYRCIKAELDGEGQHSQANRSHGGGTTRHSAGERTSQRNGSSSTEPG